MYSATCSFNTCAEQSHKDSVEKTNCGEQLGSKITSPAMRTQPRLTVHSFPGLSMTESVTRLIRDREKLEVEGGGGGMDVGEEGDNNE